MAVALGLLCAAEGAVRLWLWQRSGRNGELLWRQHLLWSGQTAYYAQSKNPLIDPLGFKKLPNQVLTQRKHRNEFRILVLGGSAVMGWDNALGHDWPTDLRDALQRYNTDLYVNVVNGGISGGLSFHENMQLWALRHYGWDAVVVYTGYNDLYYFFLDPSHYRATQAAYQSRFQRLNLLSEEVAAHSIIFAYLRNRRVQRQLAPDKAVFATPFGARSVSPEELLEFQNHLKQQTAEVILSCQSRHIPLLYVIQPFLSDIQRLRPLTVDERKVKQAFLKQNELAWDSIVEKHMPLLVESIQSVCQTQGVPFSYFRDILSPYSEAFYDDVHNHKSAMAVIGLEVGRLVQEKILKRSTQAWMRYQPTL